MLPKYTTKLLVRADEVASNGSSENVYAILRRLPLADFCALHMGVPEEYQRLKALVPSMPPPDVQKKWVGDSGRGLMGRSCAMMRLIEVMAFRANSTGPRDKNILDYGCGWGRLLRLANYYSPIEKVCGLDVMQSSLDECKKSNVPNQVALADAIPEELPFLGVTFDIAFSFSVFTHIPEFVARAVLLAVRKRIADGGVFIITIRSYEFWGLRQSSWPDETVRKLQRDHETDGYAFQTFNSSGMSANYGDTTMSFDFVERIASECGWRVSGIDRDMSEPFQIAVALQPA